MNAEVNWVVVGRFGRPHGIKGYVTVHSFTDPRDKLLDYKDWHVSFNKQWQPIRLLEVESQLKAIIARVEGFPVRESLLALSNAEIAVQISQLPRLKAGEYYWHELIGMHVINNQGESFGRVVDMMATGSNDVLVVEGSKRHLIPYLLGDFVLTINKEKRVITVDWDMDF